MGYIHRIVGSMSKINESKGPVVRRFLKGRRGVSHIISVLLVTVMTLALSVSVFVWAVNLVGQYQGSYGILFSQNVDKLKECFVIEDIWFVEEDNITIYVKNVGEISIKVVSVYVNYVPVTTSPSSQTIGIGKHEKLCVIDQSWTSGQTYHITIVTERGNIVSMYWQA